jgi:hypothetical protein
MLYRYSIRLNISPAEIVALSDNNLTLGPTSAMRDFEEAMKHRDFRFHLKHLEALRARVGLTADQPEPSYSLVNEVKDQIADLTHLIACVLRYNRFYDQLLDDKLPSSLNGIHPTTSRNVSLVPLVGSLQLVTGSVDESTRLKSFGTFEEYINQRPWLVVGAPIPSLDAYELDHSHFWMSDSSLTIERMENKAVDGEGSAVPSVQSAPTSSTDLMHHPVVSDVFIPTTTRAGRTTKVTKKYLKTARITANQQSNATSSLRPTGGKNALSSSLLVLRFELGRTAALLAVLAHLCFNG